MWTGILQFLYLLYVKTKYYYIYIKRLERYFLWGHIELNELPEETCIREEQEEAGLKINLYNPINNQLKSLCELLGENLKSVCDIQHNILTMANEVLELLGEGKRFK